MVRKPDQPLVDLKSLRLPLQPKVLDVRSAFDWSPLGHEYLQVWVVLEGLSAEQEDDVSWADPIRDAVLRQLQERGDERVPVFFFRLSSELRDGDLPPT